MNSTRNADHTAGTCERFVHSIVIIQDCMIIKHGRHMFEKFTRCAKVCGLFFLIVLLDADWLARPTPTTWVECTYNEEGKLRVMQSTKVHLSRFELTGQKKINPGVSINLKPRNS